MFVLFFVQFIWVLLCFLLLLLLLMMLRTLPSTVCSQTEFECMHCIFYTLTFRINMSCQQNCKTNFTAWSLLLFFSLSFLFFFLFGSISFLYTSIFLFYFNSIDSHYKRADHIQSHMAIIEAKHTYKKKDVRARVHVQWINWMWNWAHTRIITKFKRNWVSN